MESNQAGEYHFEEEEGYEIDEEKHEPKEPINEQEYLPPAGGTGEVDPEQE